MCENVFFDLNETSRRGAQFVNTRIRCKCGGHQLVRNDRNETIAGSNNDPAGRRLNRRRAFVIRAAFRRIYRSPGFIIPLEIVRGVCIAIKLQIGRWTVLYELWTYGTQVDDKARYRKTGTHTCQRVFHYRKRVTCCHALLYFDANRGVYCGSEPNESVRTIHYENFERKSRKTDRIRYTLDKYGCLKSLKFY